MAKRHRNNAQPEASQPGSCIETSGAKHAHRWYCATWAHHRCLKTFLNALIPPNSRKRSRHPHGEDDFPYPCIRPVALASRMHSDHPIPRRDSIQPAHGRLRPNRRPRCRICSLEQCLNGGFGRAKSVRRVHRTHAAFLTPIVSTPKVWIPSQIN